MERGPSPAANTLSTTQEISGLLCNPNVRHRAHNIPSLDHIHTQLKKRTHPHVVLFVL